MTTPVLFGAAYSVYTRICRLAFAEKGVTYRFEEVDVFGPGGAPETQLRRQPFGKIPAFEHDGFTLYETGAITRYIDEVFAGPPLQPAGPQARSRLNQAISILDAYAYPHWVWGLFVERVRKPQRAAAADEAKVAAALPVAKTCCEALANILRDQPFLCGEDLSLADLHAAPMLACLAMTEEGKGMIAVRPAFAAWWERLRLRPGMAETRAVTED